MATLPIAVDARKARSGARQANQAFDSMTARAKRTGSAVRNIFVGISAGLIVRSAIRTIAGFEETMKTVGAVTRATEKDFASLENTARTLGATTRFSAKEAAEGLLFLARAGFETNEAIAALPSTLDLASAGTLDLGTAADIASNILSQFNIEAGDTARVVDTLVITANRANTNVAQLAEAFKLAGPVAGALGISVEKTAAAIGVLGDRGIQGSLAGTNLRGVLSALLGPTGRAKKALSGLGIELGEVNPATVDLVRIFQRFKDANLTAAAAVQIFGRRNAAAALIFADSTEKMKALALANFVFRGEAERVAKAMNDTLAGAFRNVKSAIEELFLQVGDAGLLGGLKSLLGIVADTIRILVGMQDKVKENVLVATFLADVLKGLAVILGVVVAVKIIGFFAGLTVVLFQATVAAAGFLVSLLPLVAILTTLAGAVLLGKFFFDEFKTVQESAAKATSFLRTQWIEIKTGFQAAIADMKLLWLDFVAFIKEQTKPLTDIFDDLKTSLDVALGNVVIAKGTRGDIPVGAGAAEALGLTGGGITGGGAGTSERAKAENAINDIIKNRRDLLNEEAAILKRQLAGIQRDFQGETTRGGTFLDSAKDTIKTLGDEITLLASKVNEEFLSVETTIDEGLAKRLEDIKKSLNVEVEVKASQDSIERMTKSLEKQKQVADAIGNAFAQNLESIVFGAATAKEALKAFIEESIKEVFRLIVTQQIAQAFSGGLSGGGGAIPGLPTGNARGNVFNQGNVVPFAFGGIVNSPTTFPLRGGRTGLMGEAGPEAIMPLQRGRDGKLGVSGGGGSRVINMTVNTPDADSFRKSQKQITGDLRRGLRG